MILRKLEKEMGQFKFNSYFLSEYEIRQRRSLRIYDILVALIAGFAALVTLLKEMPSISGLFQELPVIILQVSSVVAVFITTIAKYILPVLVPNQSRLMKISKYQQFYTTNYNLLEKLWYSYSDRTIDKSKLTDDLYSILEKETEINTGVNEVVKRIPKKDHEKAKLEALQYLKIFDTKNGKTKQLKHDV